MSWFYLLLAGVFEAGWLIAIDRSESFSKIPFVLLAISSMAISLFLFALSLQNIAVTVAYMVWLAVGVLSVVFINYVIAGSAITGWQMFFMCLIFVGIAGIKFS